MAIARTQTATLTLGYVNEAGNYHEWTVETGTNPLSAVQYLLSEIEITGETTAILNFSWSSKGSRPEHA